MTDRFALKDGGSVPCITDDRKYCGGSYQGIINKLDYIQGLGFDAVWISPIVANVEGATVYGEAYHGYWAQNLYQLNTHFGPEKDLIALSEALHKRDMYLMVDVVANHFGPLDPPGSYGSFNPFNEPSYFHPRCLITNYDNQTDVEQCWLGDDKLALADLNTENVFVVGALYNWIQSLTKRYGIDGLRIDTVKHIRKDFWPPFAALSGVYTVGEVYHGDTAYVKDYTCQHFVSSSPFVPDRLVDVIDGVLDYPTWYQLFPAFKSSTGNLSALADVIQKAQHTYKTGLFGSAAFSENHDQPRFPSLTNDIAVSDFRPGVGLCLPVPHTPADQECHYIPLRSRWNPYPLLWYVIDGQLLLDSDHSEFPGQEQGYTGGSDPFNREA